MLRIEIVNDGTANKDPKNISKLSDGTDYCIVGNYDYRVYVNLKLVGKGRIENHLRLSGWEGLISCLNEAVNGDRFKE